jgi:hypothetical protein
MKSGCCVIAIFFGVAVIIIIASAFLFKRREAVRDSRRIGVPDARRTATFHGGLQTWKKINVGKGSMEEVRLEFFDWGIRLRGVGIMRPVVPVREAQYEELTEARLVTAHKKQGVRLHAAGIADPMIFWTRQDSNVLDRLEEHAVSVDRAADQVSDPPSMSSVTGGF